jgi:hypothetical protein
MNSTQKRILYNSIFIAVCVALFLFLWHAPLERTPYLPHDGQHERFKAMDKKEAEQFCTSCHAPGKLAPLPDKHPPAYRCLFCHKRK